MKKCFFTIIILILVLCIPVLLIACSEAINKDNVTTQLIDNSTQSGDNNADSTAISFDTNQIIATLIGGACSIIGGVFGGVITVLINNKSEKKKLQINYFKNYFSCIHKYQKKMEEIKQEEFNLQECESIIEEFQIEFEKSDILSFYIGQLYYIKGIEKLNTSLKKLISDAKNRDYKSQEMYKNLYQIFEDEKDEIKKRIH